MLTIYPFRKLILLTALLAATTPCVAQPGSSTLFSFDFSAPNAWPQSAAYRNSSQTKSQLSLGAFGTIDVAGSTEPSGALRLAAEPASGAKDWTAGLVSGPMALRNAETNLGKLTLSFSLSVSMARPVRVKVASYNTAGKRTGGLETLIYPAASDFYQRYALDLSTFKPSGTGKFQANAPKVGFAFEIGAAQGWPAAKAEVRVDNVHYAVPAYYVSPSGNDLNDGRTEKTAFATAQRAVDLAQPGDITVMMNGTYYPVTEQGGQALIQRSGTPAAWIVLKNYPGHKPLLSTAGAWSAVRIGRPRSSAPDGVNDLPGLCYLEVRGFHMRGVIDTLRETRPETIGAPSPYSNGGGAGVDGGFEKIKPHHMRFADNIVEFCGGGGLSGASADWISIENNVVRDNCWTTIYGGSAISLNGAFNFDGTSGGYRNLISNNIVSGNRTFVAWRQVGRISDGNGIIIDVNQNSKLPEEQRFNGRTLIQNNVAFNNGGSGIHAYKSSRIDMINNTVYLNSASPELEWGQMFVQQANDVRMINNIVVAPNDQPVNTNGAKGGDQNSKNIFRANNLYFGGGSAPLMGEGDKIGDPMFLNPSIDEKVADFRLKAGSPALGEGRVEAFSPILDLDGKPRGASPTVGAYQR